VFENIVNTSEISFRTCEEVWSLLKKNCAENSEVADFQELGCSEEGRPIVAAVLGSGPKTVCLIAGAHSDEPVGPEMLRTFIFQTLAQKDRFAKLLSEFKFIIVPHINPDGEAKNQPWIKKWPNVEDYLRHAFRELPGRDMEFGYPDMREENKVVADFLKAHAPYAMHMSLHGMGFSDGGFLLIEKHWIDRTQKLRDKYSKTLLDFDIKLHDHDRNGEKGFQYIGPGFTTTPEGQAMRTYFKSISDEQTAGLFHDSSMEFVRKLGGDPLCLVTEIPLFYIEKEVPNPRAGVPAAYLEFKEKVPELKLKLAQGESIAAALTDFEVKPLDLKLQMELQLTAIELGLETITS